MLDSRTSLGESVFVVVLRLAYSGPVGLVLGLISLLFDYAFRFCFRIVTSNSFRLIELYFG